MVEVVDVVVLVGGVEIPVVVVGTTLLEGEHPLTVLMVR